MDEMLKQLVGKISSYNLFNNLYPGILFCCIFKLIFKTSLLSDDLLENLVIFYFIGMVISRIGSIVIEPILKKISYKDKNSEKKRKLIEYAPYGDYKKACDGDPIILTLSEVNNTYRTLLSTFVSILMCKAAFVINNLLENKGIYFFKNNYEWIILILLIVLFLCSYAKQTNYVRKSVESYINRFCDSNKNSKLKK